MKIVNGKDMKSMIILLIIISMVAGNLGLNFYEQSIEPSLSNSKIDMMIEHQIRNASPSWEKVEIPPAIFIQTKLYNSDGQFIGYNEGIPQISSLNKAIEWIEQTERAQKSTVIIDGKSFERLQFEDYMHWSEDQSHAQYYLELPVNGQLKDIVSFRQDSFLVENGDYAEFFWTVLKPLS